jgi:hypothetical protein
LKEDEAGEEGKCGGSASGGRDTLGRHEGMSSRSSNIIYYYLLLYTLQLE